MMLFHIHSLLISNDSYRKQLKTWQVLLNRDLSLLPSFIHTFLCIWFLFSYIKVPFILWYFRVARPQSTIHSVVFSSCQAAKYHSFCGIYELLGRKVPFILWYLRVARPKSTIHSVVFTSCQAATLAWHTWLVNLVMKLLHVATWNNLPCSHLASAFRSVFATCTTGFQWKKACMKYRTKVHYPILNEVDSLFPQVMT